MLKARFGGSRDIFRANDRRELESSRLSQADRLQRVCPGEESRSTSRDPTAAPELDPADDDRVEGRRVDQGDDDRDPELIDFGRLVAEELGIRGRRMQCFRRRSGRHEVTDVNPRFGGAFRSRAAGSRYPELALALARGAPRSRAREFRRAS